MSAPDGEAPAARPVLRPIPQWAIVAGLPAMLLIAVATAWLLLSYGPTSTQLDALRTAGTLVVGFGGAGALWIAVRRQRSTELDLLQKYEAHQLAERVATQNAAAADQTAAHAERDALERRLTDLYLKAVEQLGSPNAAVRNAGLYTLENVGQEGPARRQAVVNVICSYLRMPFRPPDEASGTDFDEEPWVHEHREYVEEREVRATAQTILGQHLRPGSNVEKILESFWMDIDLNLSGATLIDLDFDEVKVRDANFDKARFIGVTSFAGKSKLDGAIFEGVATFDGAVFADDASFVGVSFLANAGFAGTKFDECAWFDDVRFNKEVSFDRANFTGAGRSYIGESGPVGPTATSFSGARFAGMVGFSGAEFAGSVSFRGANFQSSSWFENTEFTEDLWFDRASFASKPFFIECTFMRGVPAPVAAFVNMCKTTGYPDIQEGGPD